jgi:cell division protein FtsZ
MHEVNTIAETITASVDPEAKIIFGPIHDTKLKKGEIKITVIATGFNPQKKSDTSDKVFGRGIVREEIDEEVEQQPVRRNSVETPQMPDKVLEEISDDDWANVPAFLRRKK